MCLDITGHWFSQPLDMCFFFFNILFIFFSIRVYHRILNIVLCLIQWDLAVSVQFSHSVVSNSLWPHGPQHTRSPCPSLTPGVYSNSYPLSWWCHPTISSSVVPFSSCLQSFLASGSFPMSWLFASGGQSIGASASTFILPMNIQDWFPLGLTGFSSSHVWMWELDHKEGSALKNWCL